MPEINDHTLKEKLLLIAQGDESAFGYFFHHFNARLLPFVNKITRSAPATDEIVQEVFLRAWLNRQRLATLDHPAAWLFRVAVNLSLTYLRDTANERIKRREYAEKAAAISAEPYRQQESRELLQLVESAVQHLPRRRRQIYRLSRQEGMSHREIAERLALSKNTVKDHLVIAVRFIKEYVNRRFGVPTGLLLVFLPGNFFF